MGTRYDLGTYFGRLQHFIGMTDPSTLLSSNTTVQEAQTILNNYQKTGVMCGSDGDMWGYRKLTDAAIHPASNEIIPRMFRVSAIAPVNIPIVFLMLQCPASNVRGTLFLHWLNQSYNTACNYANRSGAEQSFSQTATAYVLAVGSACSFAYGLGRLPFAARYGPVIPLAATAAANVSNLGFTRSSEITVGAPVRDHEGTVRGISKAAGTQGVVQTALTRCVLVPAACLMLPPLTMSVLKGRHWLPRSGAAIVAVELAVIYGSLQAAMPAALAVFPQVSEII